MTDVILIAGIGNVFMGDDGFGVAVARELTSRALPDGVCAMDFGIRGLDLAYALLGGYRAAILIDVVQRGAPPGTLSVIAPELPEGPDEPDALALSPHAMDPASVLRLVRTLGGCCPRILLVACEGENFGDDEFGAMELSPAVAAAVGPAADTVARLACELSEELLAQEVTR